MSSSSIDESQSVDEAPKLQERSDAAVYNPREQKATCMLSAVRHVQSFIRNAFHPIFSLKRSNPPHLHFIDGLRALSMLWVMAGHALFILVAVQPPKALYDYQQVRFTSLTYWTVAGATFAVDTFFFMSGFSLAHSLLPYLEKQETFAKRCKIAVIAAIRRFLRLGGLVATFLVFLSVPSLLPEVPLPGLNFVQRDMMKVARDGHKGGCRRHWPAVFMLTNNFASHESVECMAWTWYLSVDWQCFLFSIFIILLPYSTAVRGLRSTPTGKNRVYYRLFYKFLRALSIAIALCSAIWSTVQIYRQAILTGARGEVGLNARPEEYLGATTRGAYILDVKFDDSYMHFMYEYYIRPSIRLVIYLQGLLLGMRLVHQERLARESELRRESDFLRVDEAFNKASGECCSSVSDTRSAITMLSRTPVVAPSPSSDESCGSCSTASSSPFDSQAPQARRTSTADSKIGSACEGTLSTEVGGKLGTGLAARPTTGPATGPVAFAEIERLMSDKSIFNQIEDTFLPPTSGTILKFALYLAEKVLLIFRNPTVSTSNSGQTVRKFWVKCAALASFAGAFGVAYYPMMTRLRNPHEDALYLAIARPSWGFLLAILFNAAMRGCDFCLNARIMAPFSRVSYAFYHAHLPILVALVFPFVGSTLRTNFRTFISILIVAMLATTVSSVLLTALIERPLNRFFDRLIGVKSQFTANPHQCEERCKAS